MTFKTMLSVILLSILILLSTLSMIRLQICGNEQSWPLNLNLIYEMPWAGATGFPITILVQKGTSGVGDGGKQRLVEGQSISAHFNISVFTIALDTSAPLSLTFTEEKGDTPS